MGDPLSDWQASPRMQSCETRQDFPLRNDPNSSLQIKTRSLKTRSLDPPREGIQIGSLVVDGIITVQTCNQHSTQMHQANGVVEPFGTQSGFSVNGRANGRIKTLLLRKSCLLFWLA